MTTNVTQIQQNSKQAQETKRYIVIELENSILIGMAGKDFEPCMIEHGCIDITYPLEFKIKTEKLSPGQIKELPNGGLRQIFECIVPPGFVPPSTYYAEGVNHLEYPEDHILTRAYIQKVKEFYQIAQSGQFVIALGNAAK